MAGQRSAGDPTIILHLDSTLAGGSCLVQGRHLRYGGVVVTAVCCCCRVRWAIHAWSAAALATRNGTCTTPSRNINVLVLKFCSWVWI